MPVKELRLSKSRLSRVLDEGSREGLVLSMMRSVVRALAPAVEGVVVVSSDRRVLEEALRLGARVVDEGEPRGLNEALNVALSEVLKVGAEAMLVVPCDVPLISRRDVEAMLSMLPPPPSAVISPSREGRGTNALLTAPPGSIPFSYGPDSLARHLELARRLGVRVAIYESPSLALDIDGPEDLELLLKSGWRGG